MHGGLFGVGIIAIIVGAVFLLLGLSGEVSADTEFGRYSGEVGAVAVILGIVLMAISVLI
jgi:hypothetical protein